MIFKEKVHINIHFTRLYETSKRNKIKSNVTTVIITSIKAANALKSCIYDICEGDYHKVKDLYKKRKNVFIKTTDQNGKTTYITEF